MNLDLALSTLHESAVHEDFSRHWETAQACLPKQRPAFLDPAIIRQSWIDGSFDYPIPDDLVVLADRIANDPALLALAWYAHWRLFQGQDDALQRVWPSLETYLENDARLFYLVVALGQIPAVQAYHATLGVPAQITHDTCRQVSCFDLNYRRGHQGQPGIYRKQFGWLRHYMPPHRLFRVGRFEFWLRPYAGSYRIFRRASDHATVVLTPHDFHFANDGASSFDKAALPHSPAESWGSCFEETPDALLGNPVSPDGYALRQKVRLPKNEWQCVLQSGDMTLEMHIPSGGGMPLDLCAQSLRDAAVFFRKYFPDAHAQAITSSSWMFSNQVEACLPPDSNLVRLLRELYLVPVQPPRPHGGLWFVFLQDEVDPATAPRETSLQCAILDYLAAGHAWHMGSMFLLCDDIPRLRTQHYRREWPPTRLTTL